MIIKKDSFGVVGNIFKGSFYGNLIEDHVDFGFESERHRHIQEYWYGNVIIEYIDPVMRRLFNDFEFDFRTENYDRSEDENKEWRKRLYQKIECNCERSYGNNIIKSGLMYGIFRFSKKVDNEHIEIIPKIIKPKEVIDYFLQCWAYGKRYMDGEVAGHDNYFNPDMDFVPKDISDFLDIGWTTEDNGQIRLPFG